jgi:tetratricopeptide (TPR) repeat protein
MSDFMRALGLLLALFVLSTAAGPGAAQGKKTKLQDGRVVEKPKVSAEIAQEVEDFYWKTHDLATAMKYPEIAALALALARRAPTNKVLARLVIGTAAQAGDRKVVDRFVAEADARPDDPALQFRAGIATHYWGHMEAKNKEQADHAYNECIRFLGRTHPAYMHISRTWLYMAVSYYRTGQQEKAEEYIENALVTGIDHDPDAHYCRADIWHRKDADKAIADLTAYIDFTEATKGGKHIRSAAKELRVKVQRAVLQKVVSGALPKVPDDLFAEDFDTEAYMKKYGIRLPHEAPAVSPEPAREGEGEAPTLQRPQDAPTPQRPQDAPAVTTAAPRPDLPTPPPASHAYGSVVTIAVVIVALAVVLFLFVTPRRKDD